MQKFRSLPISLLVALLVAGPDVALGRLDNSLRRRDFDDTRQTTTGDFGIFDDRKIRNVRLSLEENAVPLTTASVALRLAGRDFLDSIGGHKLPGPGGFCDANPLCSSFSVLLSQSVSSSVSSAVSSAVARADASILTATLSEVSSSASGAVQSARAAGFEDGRSQASESAQGAIDSARASAALMSSIPKCEPTGEPTGELTSELTSEPTGEPKGKPQGEPQGKPQAIYRRSLNLDPAQLAGIVVGVFLSSSLLSILATVLLLRYRRRRIPTPGKTFNPSVKSVWPRPRPRPTSTNFWASILPWGHKGIGKAGHQQIPEQTSPALRRGAVPPQPKHRRAVSSVDVPPFASLISPVTPNDQRYLVSPLSDKPGRDPARWNDQRHGSQIDKENSVGFQPKGGVIKPLHRSDPPQHTAQDQPREEYADNEQRPPLGLRTGPNPIIVGGEQSKRIKGKTALPPIATTGRSYPPTVPLRFSSLNAYGGMQAQPQAPNPIISFAHHGDDDGGPASSFFPAGPESATRSHPFSPQDTLFPSPPAAASSAAPNCPDPQTQLLQPISRFSMSPTPHSSVEYSLSISSSPPASHYHQEQLDMIIPLRPAPPSPEQLQLQSSVPQRPNIAANVASMEPVSPRTP